MSSNQRVAIGTVIGTAFLGVLTIWIIAWVGADAAMKPDPPRDSPFLASYSFIVQDIEFPARDATRITGWFIAAAPPPGEDPVLHPSPTIILVHSYGGTRDTMLPAADMFTRAGFHVVIFDERGTGHSIGANVTFGALEPLDVLGALDYLLTRPDVDRSRVGVMGVGLGGSVAIMAASQDDRLRAIAVEAPYASLNASLQDALSGQVGLPKLILRPLATRILLDRIGVPLDDRAPLGAAAKLGTRPVMVIADTSGSTEGTEAIYAAVTGPKRLWVAPGTSLGSAATTFSPDYVTHVLGFWREVFDPSAPPPLPTGVGPAPAVGPPR